MSPAATGCRAFGLTGMSSMRLMSGRRRTCSPDCPMKASASGARKINGTSTRGVDLPPLIEDIPAELLDRRDKIERRFSGHKVIQRGIVRNQRSIEFKASGGHQLQPVQQEAGQGKDRRCQSRRGHGYR